ncbi:MAG: hypothetical protein IJ833_03420 [Lachnospiraceae bacterium]|nr:hypothetical protein [Lachnospiraceae bacterium]
MADAIETVKKELTAAKADVTRKAKRIKAMELQLNEQNKVIQALQEQANTVLERNKTLQKQFDSSYTAEELSRYLNRTIADFNSNGSTDTSYAQYVISSMDVDLKAQVYHDGNGTMRFAAPNLEQPTEEGLSSIKISIRAIPK